MGDKVDIENLYAILGTDRTASKDELKKRYQTLALKFHPDKRGQDGSNVDNDAFHKISEAWKLLSDDEFRNRYDAQLKNQELCKSYSFGECFRLEEMIWSTENSAYYSSCRCGGQYALAVGDIVSGTVSVNCDTCSLNIQIVCELSETNQNKEVANANDGMTLT